MVDWGLGTRVFERARLSVNRRGAGLVSDWLIVAHGFAEPPDRVAEVRPQAFQAPGSEQHDHDQQEDQEFSGTEATLSHCLYSVARE